MRVALFTDTFPPEVNGVANSVVITAGALQKRGHAVCVCTASAESRVPLESRIGATFPVFTVPSIPLPVYTGFRFTLPLGFALPKMRAWSPDIIHSHTLFWVGKEGRIAARRLGVPLVGTHHTFFNHYLKHLHADYGWSQRLSWSITVGYYNRCDLVLSPTTSLSDELRAHGLKKACEVVPNAIDTESFKTVTREIKAQLQLKHGIGAQPVIYMGRVSYEKSIDQVIRALACALQSMPDLSLVVAGDGPQRNELEQLANELNVGNKVFFKGFVFGQELVELLQASELYVTASKSENMPLAVIEAMACGSPILAVNSLGLAEMVEDGLSGYLLPPDDPSAIATHIVSLMQNHELRKRFSNAAITSAARYSEDTMARHLEDIYMRVISLRRS